eukprot:449698-Prymnesium_polylepis.2
MARPVPGDLEPGAAATCAVVHLLTAAPLSPHTVCDCALWASESPKYAGLGEIWRRERASTHASHQMRA